MSNFDQRDQKVNKQINVNNQTNIGISPDVPQKLSEIQKIYHWANLILVPIILLFVLTADTSSATGETMLYVGVGYLVISGLFNDMTRGWLFKFFEVVIKTGCALGWIGPVAGVILLFVLVLVIGVAGVFVLMAALWIASLLAIIQDNSNQTDTQ